MSDSHANAHLVAKKGFFTGLHRGISIAAKGMIAAFVIFTAVNVEFAGNLYGTIRSWIETGLALYYITLFSACLYLMFSKWGGIRLGDDDSRPKFTNFSWFAMLFSAGIGILFFGIAEPVICFDNSSGFG